MTDYVKLSELIEKVHELEPAESDCEFLDERVDDDTLIHANFDVNTAVRETMDLLIHDQDVADLMGIPENTYETLEELAAQGSSSAAEKLNSLWGNAYNATYSRIHEYQAYSIGVYLTDTLKGFGYTNDSLVHPCIVDAIDLCIDDATPDLGDFENALDGAIEDYFGIYTNLPEDFEFESLDTKFKFIKDHTEGFSPDIHEHIKAATRTALVLENCPDFSSVKQQLKDKDLSPRTHTSSLSDLAQEAKTASHALSNNDRNIEVKEHEER